MSPWHQDSKTDAARLQPDATEIPSTISRGSTMEDNDDSSFHDAEILQVPRPSCEENEENNNDDKGTVCPLFMEGLPTDFATNPQLAAIASLLEEEQEEEEEVKPSRKVEPAIETVPIGKPGGGKIRSSTRHQRRQKQTPYQTPKRKPKASMGEAQLFLKMWKL